MPRVENLELLSKVRLTKDITRLYSYCWKKEPRSTRRVESLGMLSKLRLTKGMIRLYSC